MRIRKPVLHGVLVALACVAFGVSPIAGAAARTTAWRLQSTPVPAGGGEFFAAACPSATSCLAVGLSEEPGPTYRFVERWDGTKWTIVKTPGPSSLDVTSVFTGVSCSAPSACTVVGYYVGLDRHVVSLVDRWNGSAWSRQTPANAAVFSSVACPTATSCFATGVTLEHWNGTAWSVVTLPAGALASGGITCLSNTYCTATGDQNGHSVLLHWNGTTWSVQTPQPVPGGRAFSLSSVGCMSASTCFAAGTSTGTAGDVRRLVERWDGTKWSIVFTPLPAGKTTGRFNAVACRKASTCILAGFTGARYYDSDSRTLVERWNGTAFTIEPTPNRGTSGSAFAGAACDPTSACIAVGVGTNQAEDLVPLIERNP